MTQKPMIYDADTVVSQKSCCTVRAEDILSACIIEDKCGLKQNSLFGTSRQQNLEDIPSFCARLAATEARRQEIYGDRRREALYGAAG